MLFQLISTDFEGLKIINLKPLPDDRGWFLKTYHQEAFKTENLEYQFPESYISMSRKNVIRGMHLQRPPCDHVKMVRCQTGKILDVVVDLRTESSMYQKFFCTELSEENFQWLYIPKGFAHGFLTLSNSSVVEYKTSSLYSPDCDTGIRWNSFGMPWPAASPILSKRDKTLPSLTEFSF